MKNCTPNRRDKPDVELIWYLGSLDYRCANYNVQHNAKLVIAV